MTIKSLWRKRRQRERSQILRRLRFILNDSLVAILMILFLLFLTRINTFVADLKQLTPSTVKFFILLICFLAVRIGHPRSYLEPADLNFLLLKEKDIRKEVVFSSMRGFFISLPSRLVILLAATILFQILEPTQQLAFLLSTLIVTQLLTIVRLLHQLHAFFTTTKIKVSSLLFTILTLSALWFLVNHFFILALLLSFILTALSLYRCCKSYRQPLNWQRLLHYELIRRQKNQWLLANFIDTKVYIKTISSPRYLQPMFRLIRPESKIIIAYLYFRYYLRNAAERRNTLLIAGCGTLLILVLPLSFLASLIFCALLCLPLFSRLKDLEHFSQTNQTVATAYPKALKIAQQQLILFYTVLYSPGMLIFVFKLLVTAING